MSKKRRCLDNVTIKHLEREGFQATMVERRITKIVTKDAFGFGDILAFMPDRDSLYYGCWLIQVTSHNHHGERRTKALASEHLLGWLHSKGRFAVLSWNKDNKPRWEEITVEQATYAAGGPAPMPI